MRVQPSRGDPRLPHLFFPLQVRDVRLAQPHRRVADVPVLLDATGCRPTGTSSTSAPARRRRRRAGHHRGDRRAPEGRISPAGHRHLERRAGRRPGRAIVEFVHGQGAGAGHPARPRRPQGVDRAPVGRPRRGRRPPTAAGAGRRRAAVAFAALRRTRASSTPTSIAARRRRLRRGRPARARRRLRRDRDPRRARLPAALSSSRRCRTTATTRTAATSRTGPGCCSRSSTRCAPRSGRGRAAGRAGLGDRLGRGRLGRRATPSRCAAAARGTASTSSTLRGRQLARASRSRVGPGYQVPFADGPCAEAGLPHRARSA